MLHIEEIRIPITHPWDDCISTYIFMVDLYGKCRSKYRSSHGFNGIIIMFMHPQKTCEPQTPKFSEKKTQKSVPTISPEIPPVLSPVKQFLLPFSQKAVGLTSALRCFKVLLKISTNFSHCRLRVFLVDAGISSRS